MGGFILEWVKSLVHLAKGLYTCMRGREADTTLLLTTWEWQRSGFVALTACCVDRTHLDQISVLADTDPVSSLHFKTRLTYWHTDEIKIYKIPGNYQQKACYKLCQWKKPLTCRRPVEGKLQQSAQQWEVKWSTKLHANMCSYMHHSGMENNVILQNKFILTEGWLYLFPKLSTTSMVSISSLLIWWKQS